MDYKYIDQLLERYWKCETSIEEENILRTFFSQEEIPSQLEKYRSLFAYEQETVKHDVLGEDFDRKMMAMIASAEDNKAVKTKVVSFTDRLKPLFKAAAIVAIFLTLGNAAQVPFQDDAPQTAAQTGATPAKGASVAVMDGDSLSIDSTQQHTSITQMPAAESAPLLKR